MIGLEVIQERATSRKYNQYLHHISRIRDEINELASHLGEHLTSVTKCRSMKDQIEFWNFYLHRSYILSELCRPTIMHQKEIRLLQKDQQILAKSLRSACMDSLANTVEAFLGLQNLTKFATQSWAAVHRSLSSALLLAILHEPGRNERVRTLLFRLLSVMYEVHSDIDPMEKSAPIARSLEAIAKLMPPEPVPAKSLASDGQGSPPQESVESHAVSISSPDTSDSQGASPFSLLNSILWGSSNSMSSWGSDEATWT
jgi:hypothetical protein